MTKHTLSVGQRVHDRDGIRGTVIATSDESVAIQVDKGGVAVEPLVNHGWRPITPSNEPLLPPGSAARLLGVTVKTLRRWEAAGKITAVRTPGGTRRFAQSEVDRIRAGAEA